MVYIDLANEGGEGYDDAHIDNEEEGVKKGPFKYLMILEGGGEV